MPTAGGTGARTAFSLLDRSRSILATTSLIDGTGGIQGSGYTLETSRVGQMMREAGYEQAGADPVCRATVILTPSRH